MHALDPRARATLVGSVAILLWSLLALITTGARGIPPFQLTALSFVVGSVVGFLYLASRELMPGGGGALRKLRQRPAAWLLGVGGLFGFHFFYFVGLARAPAIDASLITYLWPLLIVLFSVLLPGERVRWFHLAGAGLGLLGAALLVTKGGSMELDARYLPGYLAALAAAVTWSSYSVLNRRFGDVPTEAVAGFCAVTALLAFACHAAMETWVQPTAGQWFAIVLLGLGPVGAAFFVWDHGTKHGDLQILGALAYTAPLLSTLCLVLAGEAEGTWHVAAACLLIAGGALLASKQMLRRRRAPSIP